MNALRIWFASFVSRCGLCDDMIEEGDRCVTVDGEACHARCADDEGYEVEP